MKVPYDETMDFAAHERGPGDWVVSVDADARFHNPEGVVHGGVLTGLLDSAMGRSMTSLLEPGQHTTNHEFHVRFLRPVTTGKITATARILKQGRTLVVWEAIATCEGDEVARATSTFLLR